MRVIQKALTFDDVLLVPAHSTVLPRDVSLKTRLTRKIKLSIPLVSAAMDTVTEARLAIAIAQEGGIGIVHKNLAPKAQAAEVLKVKRFESGVLRDPMTVSPDITVRELVALTQQYKVSGFPVVDQGKVVGMVTNRDYRFEINLDAPVRTIMTPRERLIYVKESASPEDAKALLHKHRLERVLVVDDGFALRGLVTVKDILKATEHPLASKDEQGKLRVGAAVGVGEGTEERVEHLVEAGADLIVVDTAHGHAQGVLDRVRWVKRNFSKVEVIGGNVATSSGAKALVDHGADGIKVGIGPGSICTTRVIAGVGVPQISAIQNVYIALRDTDVPFIADGGIRYSGDVAKAIAAGANAVMMGSMFAGTEETPGDVVQKSVVLPDQQRSVKVPFKVLRGMASIQAIRDRLDVEDDEVVDLESLGAEGTAVSVPARGSVRPIVQDILKHLCSSISYGGARSLDELREMFRADPMRYLVKLSASSKRESYER